MKICCLEIVSTEHGGAERIWHTNRRALERYARTLTGAACQVRGIETFNMPMPMTESRIVAFLNAHCASFTPPDSCDRGAQPEGRHKGAGSGSSP